MKKLLILFITCSILVVFISCIADLHSRVIALEEELEFTRNQVQENTETLYHAEEIEIAPGGWLRMMED